MLVTFTFENRTSVVVRRLQRLQRFVDPASRIGAGLRRQSAELSTSKGDG